MIYGGRAGRRALLAYALAIIYCPVCHGYLRAPFAVTRHKRDRRLIATCWCGRLGWVVAVERTV
jgi:hypothetical protein